MRPNESLKHTLTEEARANIRYEAQKLYDLNKDILEGYFTVYDIICEFKIYRLRWYGRGSEHWNTIEFPKFVYQKMEEVVFKLKKIALEVKATENHVKY